MCVRARVFVCVVRVVQTVKRKKTFERRIGYNEGGAYRERERERGF